MAILNTIPLTIPQALRAAIAAMQLGYTAYFHGEPGIGKSWMLAEYAKQQGWGFHAEFLGQKSAGEVRGLPFVKEGVTHWTMPDFLHAAINNPDQRYMLLLDELSAAPPDVQVSAYQLLQSRQLGEHRLPDNVLLCGAGNRPEDGAIAYEMGTALSDRLCHFNVVCDVPTWLEWAQENQLHPKVLAFIQRRPRYLNREYVDSDYGAGHSIQSDDDKLINPTPRSWHRVSTALFSYPNDHDMVLNGLAPGWLGMLTAHSFGKFIANMDNSYPPEEYYTNWKNKQILFDMQPTTQDALYGLVYNIVYLANTLDRARIATVLVDFLCGVCKKIYGNEIKNVAFDMLSKAIVRNGWLYEFVETPEYQIVEPFFMQNVELQQRLQGN